jgi:hypothetical protein
LRKWRWIALAALCLSGCAKSPDLVAAQLLKAGNRDQALQVLEKAKADTPDNKPVRYLLFVIYQDLVAQGEPAKHDAYLQSAIENYSWIAKNEGINEDYRDMEGSIKSKDSSRASYQAAYGTVFNR